MYFFLNFKIFFLIIIFFYRNCNHTLGLAVCQFGWEGSLFITNEMMVELDLCKTHFHSLNGRPIFLEEAVVSVLKPIPASYSIANMDPEDRFKHKEVFCSGKIGKTLFLLIFFEIERYYK
jgi:hypothetical protein